MLKRKASSGDQKPSLSDHVRHFDDLPNSAYVRLPTICALYSISPMTVWRWVKADPPRLPAPTKLSPRVSAWNVGELRAARKAAA
jgi:predicted DNA-binding transcriptional regulator AlpA